MTSFEGRLPCCLEAFLGTVQYVIAAKADFENLYDKPYEDRKKVRVAGPFTVESLPPTAC